MGPLHKSTRRCLNFIACDRAGCIVQIARALHGTKVGQLLMKEEYLKPTQMVQAILRMNAVPELTPFEAFMDRSLERIDRSAVPSIADTMRRVKEQRIKDEENELKRKREENESEKALGMEPSIKKQRTE